MRKPIALVALAFIGGACVDGLKVADDKDPAHKTNDPSGGSRPPNVAPPGSVNPDPDVPPVPVDPAPPLPPTTSTGASAVPLRRLTEVELNNTLRDLFPSIALPHVTLNDGEDPSNRGGYEGDVARQTPSDLVIEQLRTASTTIATAAIAHKASLLPRAPIDATDEVDVGHEFIADFGARAFRRPLEARELTAYNALFDLAREQVDFDAGIQLVISALLQSPAFIYRVELGGAASDQFEGAAAVSQYEMASRLSYLLWSSMPDQELFDAAAQNALSTPEDIELQARRMLADAKAKDALLSFHRQWLDFDRVSQQERDAATYPQFNDALRTAMRKEADALVENVMINGDARLHTLLTTTTTRVDGALASLYGVTPPASDWDLVELPGDQRAGVLTQAAFLTSRAHAVNPSPVLRGVFILDRFLCMAPPPPGGEVNTTPPQRDPNQQTTNRDRYAQHTFDPVCQGCHQGIDGIGFGLEAYDAIGKYRTEDNGLPVDDSGDLSGVGVGGTFEGGVQLAQTLADSPLVEECVARQWLTYARGRAEDEVDWGHIAEIAYAFRTNGGDVRELLVALVTSPSFRFMPQVTP
jgi:hypothetical protein